MAARAHFSADKKSIVVAVGSVSDFVAVALSYDCCNPSAHDAIFEYRGRPGHCNLQSVQFCNGPWASPPFRC
jgi:hypothetical protein